MTTPNYRSALFSLVLLLGSAMCACSKDVGSGQSPQDSQNAGGATGSGASGTVKLNLKAK